MSRSPTACPHRKLVDNYKDAEVTCLDCGRVLDRIVGEAPRLAPSGDLGGGDSGAVAKHSYYLRSSPSARSPGGFPTLGSRVAPEGEPAFPPLPPQTSSPVVEETVEFSDAPDSAEEGGLGAVEMDDDESSLGRVNVSDFEDRDDCDSDVVNVIGREPDVVKNNKQFQIDRICSVLDVYHMNNDLVRNMVIRNYNLVYGDVPKDFLRKNCQKDDLAAAFAIVNTLARLGQPVPPEFICDHLNVKNPGLLLNLPKHLGLSDDYLKKLSPRDHELSEMLASDFVGTLMNHLNLSTYVINETCHLAATLQERHPGKQPTVLAAAAIQRVLKDCPRYEWPNCENCDSIALTVCHTFDKVADMVCKALNCRQSTVDEVLKTSLPCLTWTIPEWF